MTELVVLLDDDGAAVGTAPKATVHHADTPLHLAFSAYLVTPDGDLLRHPARAGQAHLPRGLDQLGLRPPRAGRGPGRGGAAPARRTSSGCVVGELRLVLPAFAYRAEMDGVVENERCPVYVGDVDEADARRPTRPR